MMGPKCKEHLDRLLAEIQRTKPKPLSEMLLDKDFDHEKEELELERLGKECDEERLKEELERDKDNEMFIRCLRVQGLCANFIENHYEDFSREKDIMVLAFTIINLWLKNKDENKEWMDTKTIKKVYSKNKSLSIDFPDIEKYCHVQIRIRADTNLKHHRFFHS